MSDASRKDGKPDRTSMQPEVTEQTVFTHYRGGGQRYSPSPGHHYDKRHFDIQERAGAIVMWTMVAVVLFWLGVDLGLIPDVFDWHGRPSH